MKGHKQILIHTEGKQFPWSISCKCGFESIQMTRKEAVLDYSLHLTQQKSTPLCIECMKEKAVFPHYSVQFCTQKCAVQYAIGLSSNYGWCGIHQQWNDDHICRKCKEEKGNED